MAMKKGPFLSGPESLLRCANCISTVSLLPVKLHYCNWEPNLVHWLQWSSEDRMWCYLSPGFVPTATAVLPAAMAIGLYVRSCSVKRNCEFGHTKNILFSMMLIIVKNNHLSITTDLKIVIIFMGKTWTTCFGSSPLQLPKRKFWVFGVLWVPAEILNSSWTMQFEKEMEDSHAVRCMYSFGMWAVPLPIAGLCTWTGAGGLGPLSYTLFSLILQVYCLPRSHQAAKALFATLYDLCLSFIYSKCVCLYNLICCSLPPLPLGEV